MKHRDLIIVGAGPAGMAAALAAHRAGARATLVDENAAVGGQIYRQPPSTIRIAVPAASSADSQRATPLSIFLSEKGIVSGVAEIVRCWPRHLKGQILTNSATKVLNGVGQRGAVLRSQIEDLSPDLELLTETSVWGCFPGNQLAVQCPGGWEMLTAKQVIFATGAYEFVPPFPGWTLPGVMTPGAAQSMVKCMGVLPGKRVVVAGSGPFLLVVANQLQAASMEVAAVVEVVQRRRFLRHAVGLLSDRQLLRQGRTYLRNLRQAGIPMYWGQLVTEALGASELETVSISRCNDRGQPLGQAKRLAADTLCVGYGFVPRTELPQLAGCDMRYFAEQGGWVARTDETLQTSVPGVRVAGDGAGIAGAVVAELEGTLAGLAAARDLGCLSGSSHAAQSAPTVRRLRQLQRFRRALDQVYRLPSSITDLATPETIVCRCEELSRRDVEEGIEFGGRDLRTLKVTTRLGMGPCQGKMCWPSAARLIAQKCGKTVEQCGPLNVRPPIVPLEMCDLAGEATTVRQSSSG